MAYQITQYPTKTIRLGQWGPPALLAAAGLAASFLYVRSKAQEAEADNPPKGQFIDVDGVRLHYLEKGSGQVVVMLHGNGILANDFDTSGLLDEAAGKYRVIAFDRPGYGYSERPRTTLWTPAAQAKLIHNALQQMGVEQPIVLGHSWGTLVALSMALDFPDDVRSLVLLSGYYYPSLRLDAPMSAPPAIPIVGDLLRFTVAPLIGRMIWPALVKRIFSPVAVPDSFRELPVWMMLRPSQLRASAAESALMVPSALVLSRRYAELKMPVMIVAGNEDKIASAGHNAGRLHDALPQSSLRLAPGQGHMVHYADADDIVCGIDAMQALPTPSMKEHVLSRV
ncbi:alpha/beta fold hydrolase [Massilia sp. TSP1-1-2]|uniref:alpha/beta fold hydrolase n=1 Tax=Massilia sp. TSP1-1-2 TaxID=2804649 RepID=UPI003CE94296